MNFEELRLAEAVYDVRREMEENGESPGADEWTADEEKRIELTQRIAMRLIANADQELINLWLKFRKGGKEGGRKKVELIIELIKIHGRRCFYANRGKGPCSEDCDLDRIIPHSRGGQYTLANCVLACSKHNRMRGDRSIEDFLTDESS
jgi:5-methylcytosine-specific restriction endonuclease McrA